MKRILTIAVVVTVLGALPSPRPADAAVRLTTCVGDAIATCNEDFGGWGERTFAVRGWCYLIRAGLCAWLKEIA